MINDSMIDSVPIELDLQQVSPREELDRAVAIQAEMFDPLDLHLFVTSILSF